jgi:hypothetical protein
MTKAQSDPAPQRQVIAFGHLPLEAVPFLYGEIARSPWRGELTVVSYAQVLRLDEAGRPLEVRESWAPERLVGPDELAACDDESILDVLAKREPGAREIRAAELVTVRGPSQEEAGLLRVDQDVRVFSVSRLFRNPDEELILLQRLLARLDCWFAYNRNVRWERALGDYLGRGKSRSSGQAGQ